MGVSNPVLFPPLSPFLSFTTQLSPFEQMSTIVGWIFKVQPLEHPTSQRPNDPQPASQPPIARSYRATASPPPLYAAVISPHLDGCLKCVEVVGVGEGGRSGGKGWTGWEGWVD